MTDRQARINEAMSDDTRNEPQRPADPNPEVRAAAEGPEATSTAIQEQLDEVIRQRDDYLDQLRRSQADFVNFQKRVRTQTEADRPYAVAPLVHDLLPVIDNFERAIDAARAAGADAIITGLDMVHRQLLEALAKHGVEPIQALDQPFDPNVHEALNQMPDPDRPEGTVVAEHSRGYMLRDRVLRPSRVAVSVQPS